ncbi:MAG TPA: hypothetical protein VN253_28690 [Kofleriaceae bacterium]|nr:hypothetical protein [Kofleriaceae bacterium]
MRRAGVAGLVIAAAAAAAGAGEAHAGPSTAVTAEGGVEADSNVQRVETGPGLMTSRVAAPVARLGARLAHTGRVAGGGYALALGALSRTVISSGDRDLSPENVLLLSGDLRWLRPIGERAVSAGVGLVAVDAIPISDVVGSRTFRTLGGDGLLVLRGGDERTLTFAFGGRNFEFKPDPDRVYDWRGPTGTVRLDLTLWQRAGGTRSIELSALFGFEARAYNSRANASACPEDAPPSESCFAGTSQQRNDRFQRAAVELTWTGRFVAAAAYQLSVTDSNSYGQSIVRHRATLSATTDLPWRLYGTALATLQIDQYPDGLLVARNLVTPTFTSLDDENRSSLQARIARQVSKTWAVEGRGAIWRNLGGTLDTTFRRALLYVGAVYNR